MVLKFVPWMDVQRQLAFDHFMGTRTYRIILIWLRQTEVRQKQEQNLVALLRIII